MTSSTMALPLPAQLAQLGQRNWWLPAWAQRCLFPFTRHKSLPVRSGPVHDRGGEKR